LYEAFSIAIASLRASKLRSFLTLLGIILSTATLIAVMSIINGMNLYVAEKIADLGAGGFMVTRFAFFGDFDPKKFMELQKKNPELSPEEFQFLREKATLAKEVGMRAGTDVDVRLGNERVEEVSLRGGTPNMLILNNLSVEHGRFFTAAENENRRMVAFIGADIKEKLFPTTDPLGKTIDADGRQYEVIGVAKRVGSVFGQSQDNFLAIPINTFFKGYGSRRRINYMILAADQNMVQQSMDEIRVLLRSRRHLPPGREDNFALFGSDSIMGAWDKLTGAIAATATAVVSVFMVVGGVVIMNIMLAVVTERTVEIGIRKSLGARRSDILWQFLVESSVLSSCGGFIGVLIAWTIALIVRKLTPVPMELPVIAVLIGVGLSAIVGLFFGIYPASRAAKLDPIEALRAEK
jgi:putative ABC transport system permease protein